MQPQLRELACLIALIGLRVPCAAAADGELERALPAATPSALSGDTAQDSPGARTAVALNIASPLTPACLAAWQRSIEAAPALLALADWPLDAIALDQCDGQGANRSLRVAATFSSPDAESVAPGRGATATDDAAENALAFLANPLSQSVEVFVVTLNEDTFDSGADWSDAAAPDESGMLGEAMGSGEFDREIAGVASAELPVMDAEGNDQVGIANVATAFPVLLDADFQVVDQARSRGDEMVAMSDDYDVQSPAPQENAAIQPEALAHEVQEDPHQAMLVAEESAGQSAEAGAARVFPLVLEDDPRSVDDAQPLSPPLVATSDELATPPSADLLPEAAIHTAASTREDETDAPADMPITSAEVDQAAVAAQAIVIQAARQANSQAADQSVSSGAEIAATRGEQHLVQPSAPAPEAATPLAYSVEEEPQPRGGTSVAEEGVAQERAPEVGQVVAAAAPQLHERAADDSGPSREVLPAAEARDSGQVRTLQAGIRPRPEPTTRMQDEDAPNPLGGALVALDDSQLDGMRAGFEADGLKVSLGIERAVLINGQLVTTTSLNIRDLQNLSGGQAAQLDALAGGAIGLVQNGPGNTANVAGASGVVGTVIQNTLNNQNISNVTVINTTVNSMQMFRSLDLQSAVRDGVVNSLRR